MPIYNLLKQIIFLCLTLIVSWILIHFMALFGIFLAIALPVLNLLFYPSIMCVWCQIRHTPHRFAHAPINSFIILVVTALSIGIVVGESKILKYFGFPKTTATVSFVIPDRNQYKLSEIFPMKIEIAGIEMPINVVQADLAFDPTRLEVVDITTEDSFAKIFLQKEYDNSLGYIRVTGGLPNPGYSGKSGTIGVVYFRGKSPGLAEVKFLESSLVLANDGRGTNVLKEYAAAAYVILPESIPEDQKREQTDVLIQKQVLGDTTDATRLEFYEYTRDMEKPMGNVLGASAPSVEPPQPSKLANNKIVNTLARIDEKILSFWRKIIRRK